MSRTQRVDESVTKINQMWSLLGQSPENERDSILEQLYRETNPNEKLTLYNQVVSESALRYIGQRVTQVGSV